MKRMHLLVLFVICFNIYNSYIYVASRLVRLRIGLFQHQLKQVIMLRQCRSTSTKQQIRMNVVSERVIFSFKRDRFWIVMNHSVMISRYICLMPNKIGQASKHEISLETLIKICASFPQWSNSSQNVINYN